MANEKLARRYALAVFGLAGDASVLDATATELHGISDVFKKNDDLRVFFESPMIDRNAKIQALIAAFENRVGKIVLHTMLLLVQKRREKLLPALVRAYDEVLRQSRDRQALTITSARPLGDEELRNLVERLGKTYAGGFDVRQEVDPRLIGGVRVQMGDRRVDGSIAGRIESLAASLFSQS